MSIKKITFISLVLTLFTMLAKNLVFSSTIVEKNKYNLELSSDGKKIESLNGHVALQLP